MIIHACFCKYTSDSTIQYLPVLSFFPITLEAQTFGNFRPTKYHAPKLDCQQSQSNHQDA